MKTISLSRQAVHEGDLILVNRQYPLTEKKQARWQLLKMIFC